MKATHRNKILILIFLFINPFPFSSIAKTMNGFDLKGALIPEEDILSGGPPRDGIPAIENPKFITSKEALSYFKGKSRAIVIEAKGIKKAYPIKILNWHEIVNDQIGGSPVVITFCPLCGTGIVFHATSQKKKTLSFGVSGLLYQSDVLLYDRQTQSLWSQLKRLAVSGPSRGEKLKVYPSKTILLNEYLKRYPETKTLSYQTGFLRDYSKSPYGGYSTSDSTYFPVKHMDRTVPIKTWSLLIDYKGQQLIVPISRLPKVSLNKKFNVSLKERKFEIQYNSKNNTLDCSDKLPSGAECLTGYYFALKTFYPQAKVQPKKP